MKLFTQRYESSWLYYFVFKIIGGLILGGTLLLLVIIGLYGTEPFFEDEGSSIELFVIVTMMATVTYITFHFSFVKADSKGLHIHKKWNKEKERME